MSKKCSKPDCKGWAFDAGLCKEHLKHVASPDKPAITSHTPAQFMLVAASEPQVIAAAAKSPLPHGNSTPLQASKGQSSSVVSQKSATLHASAGGGAASSPTEAIDAVPSAFDISVTSVSSLQNWLVAIPDLPLGQALEQLRPHCPGLSVELLADIIESNDFEVAAITVRHACSCVFATSCFLLRIVVTSCACTRV
jgi:hypothetical protein